MKCHELPDTRQDARRAAHFQIGAPDIRPAALNRHAAGSGHRVGEPFFHNLLMQDVFQPGGTDKENLNGGCVIHIYA